MEKNRIIVVLVLALVIIIPIIFLTSKKKEVSVAPLTENEISGYEKSTDTTSFEFETTDKWFPVPITSIETGMDKKFKYFVTLENGMAFYTNKKYNLSDTIMWMDENGKMTNSLPK